MPKLQTQPSTVVRDRMWAVAGNDYRPYMSRIIPQYKDDGALHLESLLASRLAEAVRFLNPSSDCVLVPIPSRSAAVRARGLDHMRRLSSRVSRATGMPTRRLLRRKRGGFDQQGLSAVGRLLNTESAMSAQFTDKPVLLVDDIITTGATLREARRALESVGCVVVGAAVIASADELTRFPKP